MRRETEQSPIWETPVSCHDGVAGTRLPSNLKQTKIEKNIWNKSFSDVGHLSVQGWGPWWGRTDDLRVATAKRLQRVSRMLWWWDPGGAWQPHWGDACGFRGVRTAEVHTAKCQRGESSVGRAPEACKDLSQVFSDDRCMHLGKPPQNGERTNPKEMEQTSEFTQYQAELVFTPARVETLHNSQYCPELRIKELRIKGIK